MQMQDCTLQSGAVPAVITNHPRDRTSGRWLRSISTILRLRGQWQPAHSDGRRPWGPVRSAARRLRAARRPLCQPLRSPLAAADLSRCAAVVVSADAARHRQELQRRQGGASHRAVQHGRSRRPCMHQRQQQLREWRRGHRDGGLVRPDNTPVLRKRRRGRMLACTEAPNLPQLVPGHDHAVVHAQRLIWVERTQPCALTLSHDIR